MAELSSELRGGWKGWWKKVVDVDEEKRQILFAMPMVLTNVIFYLIPVVSVMFAGHLGDLQLAASNLANSWAKVTGYAIMNLVRFLQTQSVTWPLVFCSLLPLLLQFGLVYILLHYTTLGFRGAALATSITYWISVVLLMVYVRYVRTLKQIWNGFSKDLFRFILTNLKLALPSTTMYCLESWAFEVVLILAGLMPNSKASTSVVAMCISTGGIAYNITYGLSAAASTRVSNELGAKRPDRAKHATVVAMKLSIVLMSIMLLAFGFGREKWARLFSDNVDIIKAFTSMTPLLFISLSLDSIQCILSGVSRGCGWQNLTTFINLSAFFGIGIPVACFFAFTLHYHAKGLWIGMIVGIASQTCALFLVTCLKKWSALEQLSRGVDNPGCSVQ